MLLRLPVFIERTSFEYLGLILPTNGICLWTILTRDSKRSCLAKGKRTKETWKKTQKQKTEKDFFHILTSRLILSVASTRTNLRFASGSNKNGHVLHRLCTLLPLLGSNHVR